MSSYTLHIQYVDRPAETRTFNQPKVVLGRDAGDIVLHDTQVSGRHGEITFDGSTLRYTDVGSTNGSFLLQGQRVANIELTPGIALRLGNSLITVQVIDAPNVAGKGRTVIAGPGMAPGFPAPMRPPGPAAPASGMPRAGMPGMPGMPAPAPPSTPPGGFAFAPTAQMQSPAMPGGFPAPPAPGGFVPQPAPMTAQAPPMHAPQHSMPAPMQPLQSAQSVPAPQPVHSMPAPQTAPPQPTYGTQPPQPSYGTQPPQPSLPAPPQSIAPPPVMMPAPMASQPTAGVYPAPGDDATPIVGTSGNDIKNFALGAWEAIHPQIIPATLITAILTVPMAVIGWFVLVTLGGAGFGGILLMVLALVQLVGSLIVFPALIRFVISVHLGQPLDVRTAIVEQVTNFKSVAPNFLLFGLVAGVAAIAFIVPMVFVAIFIGPIFFVEGKRYIDAIRRNFEMVKRDWVTVTLNVLVPALVGGVALAVVGIVLGLIPFIGVLLGMLGRAIGQAILTPIVLMLMTRMYFIYRRQTEGGDPEAEARGRLGVPALPTF